MAFPTTLLEKKNASYIWFANAVAAESEATPNHDKRLALARQMASLNPPFDSYVTIDFALQGFSEATALNDVQNRLSGLATNLITLGY